MTSTTGPTPLPHAPLTPSAATVAGTAAGPAGQIAYASHIGMRRPANNDHVAVRVGPEYTALVVADGVGTGEDAGEAARIAAEVAGVVAAQTGQAVLACTTARHAVLGNFDGDEGWATSTLTVAVIGNRPDQHGGVAYVDVAWLGDSNVWVHKPGSMERITRPHNPDDDEHMVLRHVTSGEPDAEMIDLEGRWARRLLVCSDGLDGYVELAEIDRILGWTLSAEQARDELIAAALEAGGRDNVTVVVAELGDAEPGRGVVAVCPSCGQADPPVTTLGDVGGTVETDCCRADVTEEPGG